MIKVNILVIYFFVPDRKENVSVNYVLQVERERLSSLDDQTENQSPVQPED